MFDEIIEKNKDNILKDLKNLISFPSVSIEEDSLDNPFGKNCTEVLNYTLNLAKNMGFKAKNLNNYCGYIEFGEGEDLVGIVGHLDVVPANIDDGWTTPPFNAKILNGKMFGRGAIDDKGPVIASLYAMKAIMDTKKINKRVRLILGLNEEKSWKCINYYKEHEEWPSIGFSPDANFPGIYAEKGILSIELKNNFSIKDYSIQQISCNNNALNVVPKYCSIILKSDNNSLPILKGSNNIKITNLDNNTFKIESFGNGFFDITSPKFLSDNNTKIEDESGILTSNVSYLSFENKTNKLIFKINLRIPVNTSIDKILEKYNELKNEFNEIEVNEISRQNPLYVDKNSYLVKTLVEIFNKKTNLNEVPIAIGGGTYARAFNNFISYGANMPGNKDMCHQVDEYINIDELILSSKIYADAIYELAK